MKGEQKMTSQEFEQVMKEVREIAHVPTTDYKYLLRIIGSYMYDRHNHFLKAGDKHMAENFEKAFAHIIKNIFKGEKQ